LSEDRESLSERTSGTQEASTLEWHRRELDPRDNEDTSPPADERIETCCIWVAECYPPSHAAALVSGLKRLGWDEWRPMDVYGGELVPRSTSSSTQRRTGSRVFDHGPRAAFIAVPTGPHRFGVEPATNDALRQLQTYLQAHQ
jgi:hypothetical protein